MKVKFAARQILTASLLFFFSIGSGAQFSLTPEQQRLLNQLPSSQRDALIEQFLSRGETPQLSIDSEQETLEQQPREAAPEEPEETEEPRLAPGSTLIILLGIAEPKEGEPIRSTEELEEAQSLEARIERKNPFVLDKSGEIFVPGIGPIALAGLLELEAKLRLTAERLLEPFDIEVYHLPLEAVGPDALQPFGYELFEDEYTGFEPVEQIPVPSDYSLGPGDNVRLQLYGGENATYELEVDRDGMIAIRELGPINVAGLTFAAFREEISRRVAEQLIGTQASVTLGRLRSIRIFVTGDVERPGAYAVNALSTITNALFVSGGVAENGTMRGIQLRRGGRSVATLDLYDLLLRGDTSDDRRVQAGDVIFVPPVGARVTVAGDVKRPGIYEFRRALSAAEALALAGGALPSALLQRVRIETRLAAEGLSVREVDMRNVQQSAAESIRDGDVMFVPGDTDQLDKAVKVVGHVFRPGMYPWRPGQRLSQIFRSSKDLRPNADLNYVLIRRETGPNSRLRFVSADLQAIWRAPRTSVDISLRERDTIYVFSLEEGRGVYLLPLLDEIRLQTSAQQSATIVKIGGRVNAPGEYPLEEGMRISDLIRAGGGLDESAFTGDAELARYSIQDGSVRRTELLEVRLAALLDGDTSADLTLTAHDYLNVKELSQWEQDRVVELKGEVAFPGFYPIYRGEMLSSVIERAGGLTDLAFPAGIVFTRETLKEREREQLRVLADRVESDLASLSLADNGQTEALTIGQALLTQLRTAEPAGRLVLNQEALSANNPIQGVVLRDGDVLRVPPRLQEITVLGEVQFATSHLYSPELRRDDYIARSGGVTVRADDKRIYVVRANGEVLAGNRSRFFSGSRGIKMNPGDTIVVPLDTDRVKPLVLWTGVTQVIYNLAIAVAAVNSF